MSSVLEIINTRSSIRKYSDKPLPEDVCKTLIEAGLKAPTAANEEPRGKPEQSTGLFTSAESGGLGICFASLNGDAYNLNESCLYESCVP